MFNLLILIIIIIDNKQGIRYFIDENFKTIYDLKEFLREVEDIDKSCSLDIIFRGHYCSDKHSIKRIIDKGNNRVYIKVKPNCISFRLSKDILDLGIFIG